MVEFGQTVTRSWMHPWAKLMPANISEWMQKDEKASPLVETQTPAHSQPGNWDLNLWLRSECDNSDNHRSSPSCSCGKAEWSDGSRSRIAWPLYK